MSPPPQDRPPHSSPFLISALATDHTHAHAQYQTLYIFLFPKVGEPFQGGERSSYSLKCPQLKRAIRAGAHLKRMFVYL